MPEDIEQEKFLGVTDIANIMNVSRSTVNKQFDHGVWGTVYNPPFQKKVVKKSDFYKKLKNYARKTPRNQS